MYLSNEIVNMFQKYVGSMHEVALCTKVVLPLYDEN